MRIGHFGRMIRSGQVRQQTPCQSTWTELKAAKIVAWRLPSSLAYLDAGPILEMACPIPHQPKQTLGPSRIWRQIFCGPKFQVEGFENNAMDYYGTD